MVPTSEEEEISIKDVPSIEVGDGKLRNPGDGDELEEDKDRRVELEERKKETMSKSLSP